MKIILSIISVLLVACSSPKTEIPTDILSEAVFVNILKEVHLAEAAFELQKTKGMEKAKNELANRYSSTYSEHNITATDFENTLNYYAQHPEKLEEIYTTVLEKLTEGRTILNQQ
jgi:hypothetical protein